MPEKKAENANKEFIGNIKEVGKKILFMGGQNSRISINKIFLDPAGKIFSHFYVIKLYATLGYHCILSSD